MEKLKLKARISGLPIYKWNDGGSVYQIRHIVANYAFQRRWLSRIGMDEIRKDIRIRTTAGIHPRRVNRGEIISIMNLWIADLDMLICVNIMVTVGECGKTNLIIQTTKNEKKTGPCVRRTTEDNKKTTSTCCHTWQMR